MSQSKRYKLYKTSPKVGPRCVNEIFFVVYVKYSNSLKYLLMFFFTNGVELMIRTGNHAHHESFKLKKGNVGLCTRNQAHVAQGYAELSGLAWIVGLFWRIH